MLLIASAFIILWASPLLAGTGRVGNGTYPEYTHAFLWTGNSTTPVDLHPIGWNYSKASAADGIR